MADSVSRKKAKTSGKKTPDKIMESVIGRTIGGCVVESKLGQGAMGAVFKGKHVGLDIPVAIKILFPRSAKTDKKSIDRFVREARSAARLQHPNIVNVLNVGFEQGLYFIVMGYVDGPSVQDILSKKGKLPLEQALDITMQICSALEIADKNHMVHRDIKPDNIMLASDGTALLADLGLAKSVEDEDASMTKDNATMGTPHYMSPEQAADAKKADHRSDLYSLGCSLYHMACGTVPYPGDSPFLVMAKHVSEPIPGAQNENPEVPDEVAAIILKLMQKEPEERYQNVSELLVDLRALKEGRELVVALPKRGSSIRGASMMARKASSMKLKAMRSTSTPEEKAKGSSTAHAKVIDSSKRVYIITGVISLIVAAILVLYSLPAKKAPKRSVNTKNDASQNSGEANVTSPAVKKDKKAEPAFNPPKGAVLAYSFDRGTVITRNSDMYVKDLSGLGNDGAISVQKIAKSKIGWALVFDGKYSLVKTKISPDIQFDKGLGISFWAMIGKKDDGYNVVVSRVKIDTTTKPSTKSGFCIYVEKDHDSILFCAHTQKKATYLRSKSKVRGTGWHHYAICYDKSGARLYVDGKLEKKLKWRGKIMPCNNPLMFGGALGGRLHMQGALDEIGIWRRALSAKEVKCLYEYSAKHKSYCNAIGEKVKADPKFIEKIVKRKVPVKKPAPTKTPAKPKATPAKPKVTTPKKKAAKKAKAAPKPSVTPAPTKPVVKSPAKSATAKTEANKKAATAATTPPAPAAPAKTNPPAKTNTQTTPAKPVEKK